MWIGVKFAFRHSRGNNHNATIYEKVVSVSRQERKQSSEKNTGNQPDGSTPTFGSRSNMCRSTSRALKAIPQNAGIGWQVCGNSTMSRYCLLLNNALNSLAFPSGSDINAPPEEQRGGISDSAPNTWPFSVRQQVLAEAQSLRFRR